jgi:hypothetical protein
MKNMREDCWKQLQRPIYSNRDSATAFPIRSWIELLAVSPGWRIANHWILPESCDHKLGRNILKP